MPRRPRVIALGNPHHVVHRGNNRMTIFLDAQDRGYGKFLLCEASTRHRCAVHAYVMMTNHLHLLVTPQVVEGLAKFMQSFAQRYVRYFNRRYGRTGTLWERRYFSECIDTDRYFFTCARYIELNPVRANLVSHPREYSPSSYRHNAFGESDALITPHPLYLDLAPTESARTRSYRGIFRTHIDGRYEDAAEADG